MNDFKIPCEECILLVICRQKDLFRMLDQCELIRNVLYVHKRNPANPDFYKRKPYFVKNVKELQSILKSEVWWYNERLDRINFVDENRQRLATRVYNKQYKYTYRRVK